MTTITRLDVAVHQLNVAIRLLLDGDDRGAKRLEEDRIAACAFKVITDDGPISMCLHNAKRDAFILKPVRLYRARSPLFWDPVTGAEATMIVERGEPVTSLTQQRCEKRRVRKKTAHPAIS